MIYIIWLCCRASDIQYRSDPERSHYDLWVSGDDDAHYHLLRWYAFPIANMPPVLQRISWIVPARHYIAACRKAMIQGVSDRSARRAYDPTTDGDRDDNDRRAECSSTIELKRGRKLLWKSSISY